MSIVHVMSVELENLGNLNIRVPYLLVVYMPPVVAYSDLDFLIEATCPKYLSLSMVFLLPLSSSAVLQVWFVDNDIKWLK